ncbi:MAG TPA: response regulator, partial [Anaeromyxobacteraceae bacterium]|nr:response regulator [Anaeromyxobacteraceae bacterium]
MIRCLVADDSRAFRAILRAILSQAQGVEVVGEAADGDEAVAKVLALRPDVVTMDVRMPGKDGLAAIAEVMARAPTPIIVVSAEAGPERQELAFRALQLGAIEVLGKPRSDGGGRFERDAEAIRMAVRAVAGLKLVTRHARLARRTAAQANPSVRPEPVEGRANGPRTS